MKIIVVGSGGREHAISWKLAQSSLVSQVICVPGNGGTAHEKKCKNIDPADCSYLDGDKSLAAYVAIAKHENCDLAVIGPEEPLAKGAADLFWAEGIPCVGPKKDGAQLEASKDFAKAFMHKYDVACAVSKTFTDPKEAHSYIEDHGSPVVIKADGLAAGKGVVVAATVQEAHEAVTNLMELGKVGEAGEKIVIEDYLEGIEISVLAAVCVTEKTSALKTAVIVPFLPARDHKRLLDGAKGPNTGGMGAVCPLSDVTDEVFSAFDKNILKPTLRGLIAEKTDYRGFIFFGLMLTANGPKLLEYNVRLGDPETQAVLPMADFDFAALCRAITDETLSSFSCKWKDGFVVAPVAVSSGYPEAYEKGKTVTVNEDFIAAADAKLFAAGAVEKDGRLITNGGRVLSCSAFGKTFDEARENSYKALKAVSFEGMFYRKDIGLDGAAESVKL
ncbi:phosphoribosylamine--glycine ligase [Treponema parvum]|uniref:Phosphoribosylamine--glycine ligase n=1 Tax=Treponema parvum TaxID=138851 RepID=A0A975F5K7_9SPIR|nr:phosphoribosylamine--glycine ligase [Treponema parvum]QTQ14887.1 phosphoribosylamine--glycine ligase [Treponema parvum]